MTQYWLSTDPKDWAEKKTILRCEVGSGVHGLALPGRDDRDEMGICIEPIQNAYGFRQFEQYIYRSAAEREQKQDAPSQPGDLDLVIYSLRKWMRLALDGNPTVLTLLFAKPLQQNALGTRLQEMAPLFASRRAGKRFLGYMQAQRQRLLGERGQKNVNRRELEEKYGYDTKYASHIIRLGYQGVEYLETGRLSLPLTGLALSDSLAIKQGQWAENDVHTLAGDLEGQLKRLLDTSPLPEQPEEKKIEKWMLDVYLESWKATWGHASVLGWNEV